MTKQYVDGVLVDIPQADLDTLINSAPTAEDLLAARRAAMKMSRAQFAIGSARQAWITEQEAEDWAAGIAIPTFVAEVIETQIPAEQKLAVRIAVRTQAEIGRTDRLIPLLQVAKGVDDAQMDAFFDPTLPSPEPAPQPTEASP